MKEQTRNTKVQINEEKIMIVKMIKILENKMRKMQESINRDLEELKNKHTETNNTITVINNRIYEAEGWISELEDKMLEITAEEQNKLKRMKITEDSFRDLWDNIKHTNI